MPSNKIILCLGNNTRDTDLLAKQYAESQKLPYHGLMAVDTDVSNLLPGVYQTSLGDFGEVTYLLKAVENFNIVIDLAQPAETFDNERFYALTRHAIDFIKNHELADVITTNS